MNRFGTFNFTLEAGILAAVSSVGCSSLGLSESMFNKVWLHISYYVAMYES